jgi:proline iminopeptidase
MPEPTLYDDTPALTRHALPVGDGHVLAVQEHGRADGIAAVVLHGGPGSGSAPLLRRFFDPARYRVISVDQRGAGASRPRGATRHNTTDHLLADLKRVREALGVERWLVVGGSWGATLALAHAAAEPQAVAALLLRAVFLARHADIAAFCQAADLDLPALAQALHGDAAEAARRAARTWWRAEQALAGSHAGEPDADTLAALVDRYRVQSHYLLAGCFLNDPPLLARCARLPPVPTLLLHGSADRICPPAGAAELLRHVPHAALKLIDGAGHDPTHPAMVGAMLRALDGYAARGDFGAGPT